jgi:hypothetical protein
LPRSAGIAVENNFSRGLVTEATGLTFPENACTETFDCIFRKTGEVQRRKGFEYETSYSLYTLTEARSESAISTFLWTGAGGDGNSSFICLQVGRYIYFYDVKESLNFRRFTAIDLDNFDVPGTTLPFSHPVSFAQGDGKLFVVGQFIEPFYIEYSLSGNFLTAGTQITIEIRDFDGDSADTLSVDQRPTASVTTDTAVVNAHLYNLMNQGWANAVYTDAPSQENPVKDWDSAESTLPSNSDRWWQLKNSNDQMDMGELDKFPVVSTESPKGHFIWNAFNVDRTSTTGTDSTGGSEPFDTLWGRGGLTNNASTLTVESTDFRPSSVAFFANRVWYAGVGDQGYNSKFYFSQILTDISRAGRCYQEQDPTSETFYDLLPTDGGVLEIPEIANVVYMQESQNSLYIFATNGIWRITGSEGIGFTATDYAVNKVSSVQNVDNQSFVDLNGVPAWINSEGVWLLQQDQTLGSVNITSLSKDSIQSFFELIPLENIPYIQGTYNSKERLVYWLYKSTTGTSTDSKYQYDRCLVFNTETGAFYPWKLNTDNDIKVLSVITSTGFSESVEEVSVVVGADTVVDSGATTVTEDTNIDVSVSATTKFLCENSSDQVTWAEQHDSDYLDWTTAKGAGKNYSSYFITGYKVRGEGLRTQQTGYVRIHSRVEANSSVQVQGVWDYYTSDGARWSTVQQGYKAKTNGAYSERRLKIRGNGLALQLRFASEQGKPFNVIGWSSLDSVSQVP